MTRKLWNYKEVAHQIYNKYRSSGKSPDKVDQFMSKKLFSIANEEVEMPLQFTVEELEEMQHDNWKTVD